MKMLAFLVPSQYASSCPPKPPTFAKAAKDRFAKAGSFKGSIQNLEKGMKSYTQHLVLNVPKRFGFKNITSQVEKAVYKSGVKEGLCLVNAMHITASVFINDNESGLHHDYEKWLEELAPFDASPETYHHNRTGEDNADAHLKRQVMGREVVVAITKGALDFGPWEQIFYGEFDGRRDKRIMIKIIGE